MLQARLGKLLGLQHEEALVLLRPDEQGLWQAALHPDAHPEGGLACNDDTLLATQRECILAWIKEVGRQILSGARFNLVNVSFPVRMFEPRSFLQKIADSWVNLELLDRAAAAGENGDPLERMKLVIAWFVAGLSAGVVWRKPFNPILGETWEAEMDMDAAADAEDAGEEGEQESEGEAGGGAAAAGEGGARSQQHHRRRRIARLFAEQVSHHPPIAAYVVEGAGGNWRFEGHVQPAVEVVVRWYGIRTASRGARRVAFSDGSSIEMFMPAFGVKGVVYSKRPRAEVVGTARLVDARNRLEAVLRFGPAVGAAAGHAGAAASGGAGARLATLARADAVVGEIYRLRGDAPVVGPSRSGALRMTPSTIGPLDQEALGGGGGGGGGGVAAATGAAAAAAAAAATTTGRGGSVAAGTDRADGSYCDDDSASYSSCKSASEEGEEEREEEEQGQQRAAGGRGGGGGGTAVVVSAGGSAATAAAAAAAAAAGNGDPHKHHHHHHPHHQRKPSVPADPRDEAIFAAVTARLDTLAVDGPPPLPMVPSSGHASPARSLTPGGCVPGGPPVAAAGGSPRAASRMLALHSVVSEPLRRSGSAASGMGRDNTAVAAVAAAAGVGAGGEGGNGSSGGGSGSGGGGSSGKTKLTAAAAANSLRLAASRLGRLGKSGGGSGSSSSKEKKDKAAAAAAASAASAAREGSPPPAAAAAALLPPPALATGPSPTPPTPPSPFEGSPLPPAALPPAASGAHHSRSASTGRLPQPLEAAAAGAAGAAAATEAAAANAAPSGHTPPQPQAPSPTPPPPAALAPANSTSFFRGGGGGGHAGALSVPGVAVARIEGSWLSHLNIDHRRYWTLMDPASPYAPVGAAAEKAAAEAEATTSGECQGRRPGGPGPAPRWRSVARPLPSDCRLREDLAFLAAGDEAESQRWKEVLERRQRHDKKLREEGAGGGGGGGGGGKHH